MASPGQLASPSTSWRACNQTRPPTSSPSAPRGTTPAPGTGTSVDAWLRRPHGVRRGKLRTEAAGRSVSGSSVHSGLRGDDRKLRREGREYLTFAVLDHTRM